MSLGLGGLGKPPPPTPEITALIEKLGSEQYTAREEAHKELSKLGYKASGGLEHAVNNSPDPEIRFRASRLLNQCYSIKWDKAIPYIYAIPRGEVTLNGRTYNFPKGAAKKYYRKYVKPHHWDYNYPVLRQCTKDLVHALLRSGMPKEDVVGLLEVMSKNQESRSTEGVYTPPKYSFSDMDEVIDEEWLIDFTIKWIEYWFRGDCEIEE